MSRRDQIIMTDQEVTEFLAGQKVVTVASIGPNGRPHLVPLWYVPHGTLISAWTFAKSQKVANLRRLAQATVQVESGETYQELRGVSMECDVRIVEDLEEVAAIGVAISQRYLAADAAQEVATAATQFVRLQAAKRVGLVFTPTHIASWDHAKLGGTY